MKIAQIPGSPGIIEVNSTGILAGTENNPDSAKVDDDKGCLVYSFTSGDGFQIQDAKAWTLVNIMVISGSVTATLLDPGATTPANGVSLGTAPVDTITDFNNIVAGNQIVAFQTTGASRFVVMVRRPEGMR